MIDFKVWDDGMRTASNTSSGDGHATHLYTAAIPDGISDGRPAGDAFGAFGLELALYTVLRQECWSAPQGWDVPSEAAASRSRCRDDIVGTLTSGIQWPKPDRAVARLC